MAVFGEKGYDRCEFGGNPNMKNKEDQDEKVLADECNGERKDQMKQPRNRRRVHFDHVEIREYSITVGDHPFCRDSCPLTLEWKHTTSVKENISHSDDDDCYDDELKSHHRDCSGPTLRMPDTTLRLNQRKALSSSPPPSCNLPRRLSLQERRQRISHVHGLHSNKAIIELELVMARKTFKRDHPGLMATQCKRQQHHGASSSTRGSSDTYQSKKRSEPDSVSLHRRDARLAIKRNKIHHHQQQQHPRVPHNNYHFHLYDHHYPNYYYQYPGYHYYQPLDKLGRPLLTGYSIPTWYQCRSKCCQAGSAPCNMAAPWNQWLVQDRLSYYNTHYAGVPTAGFEDRAGMTLPFQPGPGPVQINSSNTFAPTAA